MIRVGGLGQQVWKRDFNNILGFRPANSADRGAFVRETPDGGFLVIGSSFYDDFLYEPSADFDGGRPVGYSKYVWILRLDSDGNVLSKQIYGDQKFLTEPLLAKKTPTVV
jgi:hypothetical protein